MTEYRVDRDAAAVDEYLNRVLELNDPALDAGRDRAHEAGLPQIEVSTAQGKFLKLLVELTGARRVLEVGTLGGFSTSWLARGIGAQGHVVTCEYEPLHARVAGENLKHAGLQDRVQIKVGAAADSLQQLIDEGVEPFDFIFIDADKRNNLTYLEMGVKLSRPGTVLVLDNVVRGGAILNEANAQGLNAEDLQGVQEGLKWLNDDPRVDATALQTVGAKGWDGFALARVL